MKEHDLKDRTKRFALRIIHMVGALPKARVTTVIGDQVLRSGTSVGAQYREAFRAKSRADYVSKLTGCLQELDETAYWLELLVDANLVSSDRLAPLMQETNELTAILTTIVLKVKQN